ncbi:MAG: site-2 protease family protein [Candidatus Methanoplasma sp.]|nr:site-2 protease family protein [Candidatus Methanoplasma sp.]
MDIDGLRRVDPGYREPRGRIRFSRTEAMHIAAAVIVLSVAFTMILYRGSSGIGSSAAETAAVLFGVSLVLVVCSFLMHEFGHKFVAQRYRAWSEFRAYPYGLLMALAFSAMGFLFAAPGAVYIRGNIDVRRNGVISLAGPAVNFAICAAGILVLLLAGDAWGVVRLLVYLNAFLGLFNMIPVAPLDGSKILAWDVRIYVSAAAVGAAEMAAYFLWL